MEEGEKGRVGEGEKGRVGDKVRGRQGDSEKRKVTYKNYESLLKYIRKVKMHMRCTERWLVSVAEPSRSVKMQRSKME